MLAIISCGNKISSKWYTGVFIAQMQFLKENASLLWILHERGISVVVLDNDGLWLLWIDYWIYFFLLEIFHPYTGVGMLEQ